MFQQKELQVHFVGISGMGMCGIAEVLLNMGYKVSGSDLRETEITKHLTSIGGTIYQGHDASNLGNADVVVTSTAIKGYNPEVESARARRIPVIPRAEMLGELMRLKYGIAVAGSHGKTTTTTMIASVLMAAGKDPTAVIGGRVNALGMANARHGKSNLLVAEADESDGSFNLLTPTIAIVTNMDAEHLDHYGTVEGVEEAFSRFVNRVPFYGKAILCVDDPGVQKLIPKMNKRFVSYGISSDANYRARNIRPDGLSMKYIAWRNAEELGEVVLPMPGEYNVQNSLAVLAACDALGLSFEEAASGIAQFTGIQRRFTVRGELGGITIVDDFGHHPTEVRATLKGARAAFPGRRIIAAFQPHRHTRTRDQFKEFARSFFDADKVLMCDIFGAGEAPIDGISSETLCQAIRDAGHSEVEHVPQREEIAEVIGDVARTGDVVITLGAGDIQLTCNEVIEVFEGQGKALKHKQLIRI